MATRLGSLCLLLSLSGASMLPLAAQELVSVRVFTEPSGPRYTVDGQQYMAPTVFRWPVGSKHTVTVVSPTFSFASPEAACEVPTGGVVQYDPSCRARYQFGGWETSAGSPVVQGVTQSITVDRN
ncbi:MAG TPA: hypothetical protein VER03_13975, partial [Bryobacteraceae bacterium]|nr:hypothetical protein [Bryobacteraceae bacterium]